jgi:hypothetical protein
VKIIAPACSASIFTPRGCVSIKILTFFYFGLWSHVKCAPPQAVQLQNYPQEDDFEAGKPKNFIFASIQNTNFPESGSRKHFQAYTMRAIDSSHEITPIDMILRQKIQYFLIFASIHTSISMNQGHFYEDSMDKPVSFVTIQ